MPSGALQCSTLKGGAAQCSAVQCIKYIREQCNAIYHSVIYDAVVTCDINIDGKFKLVVLVI